MDIKKTIYAIVKKGKVEDMEYLSDVMADVITDFSSRNKEWFNSIEMKLHKLAYGNHLCESMAIEWTSSMENKDGTKGGHWSMAETKNVRTQFDISYNEYDWYAVLNMMYSDYYNVKFDTDVYINLAKDWFDDIDGSKCKTLKYYMYIYR